MTEFLSSFRYYPLLSPADGRPEAIRQTCPKLVDSDIENSLGTQMDLKKGGPMLHTVTHSGTVRNVEDGLGSWDNWEIDGRRDWINSKLLIRLNKSHYEQSKQNFDDTQLVNKLTIWLLELCSCALPRVICNLHRQPIVAALPRSTTCRYDSPPSDVDPNSSTSINYIPPIPSFLK